MSRAPRITGRELVSAPSDGAAVLASGVVAVDNGTQSTRPADTHIHAMGGRGEGVCDAYSGVVNQLRGDLAKARNGDRAATFRALHTVQDSYATSHQYKGWNGNYTPGHYLGDSSSVGTGDAQSASVRLLKGIGGTLPLGSPSSYLYPKPARCK